MDPAVCCVFVDIHFICVCKKVEMYVMCSHSVLVTSQYTNLIAKISEFPAGISQKVSWPALPCS